MSEDVIKKFADDLERHYGLLLKREGHEGIQGLTVNHAEIIGNFFRKYPDLKPYREENISALFDGIQDFFESKGYKDVGALFVLEENNG